MMLQHRWQTILGDCCSVSLGNFCHPTQCYRTHAWRLHNAVCRRIHTELWMSDVVATAARGVADDLQQRVAAGGPAAEEWSTQGETVPKRGKNT